MNPHFIGIDLGQMNDYTALALVDRKDGVTILRVLYRTRLRLYSEMLSTCANTVIKYGGICYGDATGAASSGNFEEFEQLVYPNIFRYVKLTAQGVTHFDPASHHLHIPKPVMIANLQKMIEYGKLKTPSNLPLWEEIKNEVASYQCKVQPSGYEVYNARTGEHDDLIIAVGLACYASIYEVDTEILTKNELEKKTGVDARFNFNRNMTKEMY